MEMFTLNRSSYPSAQRLKGRSLVLFANQDDVLLNAKERKQFTETGLLGDWSMRERQKTAWLRLVRKTTIRRPKVP